MSDTIKTLANSQGSEVAVDLISEVELKRHDLVESILTEIEEYKAMGVKLSEKIDQRVDAYMNWVGRRSKVRNGEKAGGNLTLSNYSQTKQILVKIHDIFSFDERINLAKMKVDNCLKRWAEESKNNEQARFLSEIARRAFNVDKKGSINKNNILRLIQTNIKDKEWIEAQKLMKDAIQIICSKKYKNFKIKNSHGIWETINLNFSTY
jgi:hypothetical protein